VILAHASCPDYGIVCCRGEPVAYRRSDSVSSERVNGESRRPLQQVRPKPRVSAWPITRVQRRPGVAQFSRVRSKRRPQPFTFPSGGPDRESDRFKCHAKLLSRAAPQLATAQTTQLLQNTQGAVHCGRGAGISDVVCAISEWTDLINHECDNADLFVNFATCWTHRMQELIQSLHASSNRTKNNC
jgi:hypothetical protein